MFNYDKSIACKANKPEINRLEIEMRSLCKDEEFRKFKDRIEGIMDDQTAVFEESTKKVIEI